MSWQAPQAPAKPGDRKTIAPSTPRSEGKLAIETMAESELIEVLRAMTVRSPEARQMLKDIQKQIDEYWRIEELRRIS